MTAKQRRLAAIERQIRRIDHDLDRLNATSARFANIRLGIVLIGLPMMAWLLFSSWTAAFWIGGIGFVGSFIIVVVLHNALKRDTAAHTLWRDQKHSQIARACLDWAHIPPCEVHSRSLHPVELDFDLGQLHRLINTCVTQPARERLREWLLYLTPDLSTIQQRQARVRECIDQTIFRHRLVVAARQSLDDMQPRHDIHKLLSWIQADTLPRSPRGLLNGLFGLAAANVILFLFSAFDALPPIWILTWAVYALLVLSQWQVIKGLFDNAAMLNDSLRQISAVMRLIEGHPFRNAPKLQELCAPVLSDRPSRHLRRVTWLLAAASMQQNFYIWMLLNAVVPWDLFFIERLYAQKMNLAERMPAWLDVWTELEVVSSLANFAYLNPDYTFPQFADVGTSRLRAIQIGHPLIADETRVCNDFALSERGEVVVLTGSNMAGKSSFLRTLGINLCLAYAGSVVNAALLETSLFRLLSCIRVTDSLDDGISYFYAEVRRLKTLLDALYQDDALPLFFVIDEIFRGTNNRERLQGSRAYIRALVNGNGLGLIATHDLELVKLADQLPSLRNFHFREDVSGERMVFDYVLRPGPCPTTNALKIMALAGLPVSEPAEKEA